MAKTTIANLITSIKRKSDYNITDADLDLLIVDEINDSLKVIKQWIMDAGLFHYCSKAASFKTVEGQSYVDITKARIVGDATTFTGVAGDLIDVWIDGTEYANINIAAAATIANVVTAINAAVGSTVASKSSTGYLVITSPTAGSSSAVKIEDNALASGAVDSLFSVSAERSQNAIYDVDEVLAMTERTNDAPIDFIPYDEFAKTYPDPSIDTALTPDVYTRLAERFYFGSRPTGNIYIYIDYIFQITIVTSASTCPFDDKFDPLIKALCVKGMAGFLDPQNRARMTTANEDVEFYRRTLISEAARNIGMNRQVASRKDGQYRPGPKMVIT